MRGPTLQLIRVQVIEQGTSEGLIGRMCPCLFLDVESYLHMLLRPALHPVVNLISWFVSHSPLSESWKALCASMLRTT